MTDRTSNAGILDQRWRGVGTLRHRLLLLVALVLASSVAIGTVLAYWRATSKVQTELHAALVVGVQIVAEAVKEIDRAPNAYQLIPSVIERFSGGRHLRVALLDRDGHEIAVSRLAMPDDPAPEWIYEALRGDPESARVALPDKIRGYGSFLIESDPRNEVQEFWEELRYGLFVLAILAVLVLAAIYWTLGYELRPLSDLRNAFSKIAAGDFSVRLADAGSGDLTIVNHGFNEMAARLEQSEDANTRLQIQLANAQDEERTQLARDLHDEIGPLLFSLGLDAAAVQQALGDSASREVQERLEQIREAVRISQRTVLDILGRLRTGSVEDLGLSAAISRLIEFWHTRHPHLEMQVDVPENGVGVDLDAIVYRVVQESFSNAVRHGVTSSVEISVATKADGAVEITVVDDGGGLKSQKAGHGITGMRERVASRSGTLTVGNRPDGKGTLVHAVFPAASSDDSGMQKSVGAA
jgi:two-component system sensor histidine kinase UhpB